MGFETNDNNNKWISHSRLASNLPEFVMANIFMDILSHLRLRIIVDRLVLNRPLNNFNLELLRNSYSSEGTLSCMQRPCPPCWIKLSDF